MFHFCVKKKEGGRYDKRWAISTPYLYPTRYLKIFNELVKWMLFKKEKWIFTHIFSVHTDAIKCPLTCNGVSCLSIYWTLQADVIWKWKASASLHARFWGLDWVRLVASLCLGQLLQFKLWLIHYMIHVWWVSTSPSWKRHEQGILAEQVGLSKLFLKGNQAFTVYRLGCSWSGLQYDLKYS